MSTSEQRQALAEPWRGLHKRLLVLGAAILAQRHWGEPIKLKEAGEQDEALTDLAVEARNIADAISRAALTSAPEAAAEPAFYGFVHEDECRIEMCFTPSAPRADGVFATAFYTAPPKAEAAQVAADDFNWQAEGDAFNRLHRDYGTQFQAWAWEGWKARAIHGAPPSPAQSPPPQAAQPVTQPALYEVLRGSGYLTSNQASELAYTILRLIAAAPSQPGGTPNGNV